MTLLSKATQETNERAFNILSMNIIFDILLIIKIYIDRKLYYHWLYVIIPLNVFLDGLVKNVTLLYIFIKTFFEIGLFVYI